MTDTESTFRVRHWLSFFGLYALAILVGNRVRAPEFDVVSALWPASGVYLAAMLLQRVRVWPITMMLAAAVFVAFYGPTWLSVCYWANNTLAALLAASLMRLLLGDNIDPTRLRDALVWIVAGVLGAIASAVGAWLLTEEAAMPDPGVWRIWVLADLLGILTIGVALVAWSVRGDASPWRHRHWREVAALLAVAVAIGWPMFAWDKPEGSLFAPPTLLFPLLIWACMRFGVLGASVTGFGLALLLLVTSAAGSGPYVAALSVSHLEQIVWAQLSLVLGSATGIVVGAATSERLRADLRNQRHREELARVDKMTSIGTLVASVAHEINSPNQLLQLNLSALEAMWRDATEVLDEKYRQDPELRIANTDYAHARADAEKLFADTLGAADRVRGIADELRSYARVGTRTHRPFAVNDAVRAAMTLLAARVRKSTRRFDMLLAEDLPMVTGQERRFEQVVVNLIVNACDALTGRDQAVQVATALGDRCVKLTVRDEGEGMNDEQLRQIGEPFFTTKDDGTGIGLAVSRQIVAEHGGTIEWESEPGKGTTATVSLPIR